jgi:hypothetical protein
LKLIPVATAGRNLTNEPTPWRKIVSEKIMAFQLVKIFLVFYGTRRFVTVLTPLLH